MEFIKTPEFVLFFFMFGIISLVVIMSIDLRNEEKKKNKHHKG